MVKRSSEMPVLENAGNTSLESNATENASIYIKAGRNRAKLQYLAYGQSQTKTTSGIAEDSGWIPIGAETRDGKTTVAIKMMQYPDPAGYPKDLSPIYQAIDYDPLTGNLLGIHRNDGGYKSINESDFGQTSSDTELLYFTNETEATFLTRFDWVINPSATSGASAQGNSISAPATYGKGPANIITNYNPKTDGPIQIDLASFEGATGKLKIAKKSKQVANLAQKNIDFIYDQQSGYLYYNENGKQAGFGDGDIFAILEGKPKVGIKNFDFA